MKLRNKKTGEIGYLIVSKDSNYYNITNDKWDNCGTYNSLAELNEEWEDAPEEPKDFWFIDPEVLIACESTEPLLCDKKVAIEAMKQIGNYFETKEETELAVRKLKAWKRLKDKGFRFNNFIRDVIYYEISDEEIEKDDVRKDLNICFGGGE